MGSPCFLALAQWRAPLVVSRIVIIFFPAGNIAALRHSAAQLTCLVSFFLSHKYTLTASLKYIPLLTPPRAYS